MSVVDDARARGHLQRLTCSASPPAPHMQRLTCSASHAARRQRTQRLSFNPGPISSPHSLSPSLTPRSSPLAPHPSPPSLTCGGSVPTVDGPRPASSARGAEKCAPPLRGTLASFEELCRLSADARCASTPRGDGGQWPRSHNKRPMCAAPWLAAEMSTAEAPAAHLAVEPDAQPTFAPPPLAGVPSIARRCGKRLAARIDTTPTCESPLLDGGPSSAPPLHSRPAARQRDSTTCAMPSPADCTAMPSPPHAPHAAPPRNNPTNAVP